MRLFIALFLLAYCVFMWVAVESVTELYVEKVSTQERANLTQRSALLRSEIEAALYEGIYLADSLASVVTIDPNLALKNWETLSEKLIGRSDIVRNLAIAPNDIIQRIYPLKGNEQALGLNYRLIPSQYPSVLEARNSGDVYLAGPVSLVQGGRGLVARFPIFSDFPQNQNYWGLVSIVVDYEALLEAVKINDIENMSVALRRLDTVSGSALSESFHGDASVFENADFRTQITLPGARWELASQFELGAMESVVKIKEAVRAAGWTLAGILLLGLLLVARAFQVIRVASLQDELTGLPNRRFVLSHLKQTLSKKRDGHKFSIFNIDIDMFKRINDTYGHDVGDDYLCFVSEYLTETLRTSDIVARIGGDEFLAVIDRTENLEHALKLKNKIQSGSASRPFIVDNEEIVLSMSIGVVVVNSNDVSLDVLLKHADEDMYKDKKTRKKARESALKARLS